MSPVSFYIIIFDQPGYIFVVVFIGRLKIPGFHAAIAYMSKPLLLVVCHFHVVLQLTYHVL